MILSAICRLGAIRLPCCTYVERVLTLAYGASVVTRAPTSMWNLHDLADPWSPVTAAVQSGVGVPAPELVGGAWFVVQGWRTPPSRAGSGHTFLLFVPATGNLEVLQVDATEAEAAAFRHRTRAELYQEFSYGLRFARLTRRPGDGL